MSEELPYCRVLRDTNQQAAVYDWWARLHGHDSTFNGNALRDPFPGGTRAALRRARQPEDALLTEGFRHLWFALKEEDRKPWTLQAWGCVAAVLAEVRRNTPGIEFAASIGRESHKMPGKPKVSELRFSQLQHSREMGELQRRLRRLLPLVVDRDNVIAVNVVATADSILHWQREHAGYIDRAPDKRLPVRWATAYFTEVAKIKQPAAQE